MSDPTGATEETCEHCGARRVEQADWCPRCLERYDTRQREVAPGAVKSFTVQSRTQRSPMTFGLVGRILVTLPFSVVIAFLLYDMITSPNGMINLLFIIPLVGVGGFVLRDVWQSTPKFVATSPTILGPPEDPTRPKPILPPEPYLTDD